MHQHTSVVHQHGVRFHIKRRRLNERNQHIERPLKGTQDMPAVAEVSMNSIEPQLLL